MVKTKPHVNDKVKAFYQIMTHALENCDLAAGLARAKKNKPKEDVYISTRMQIESLLWKYNAFFEEELNHELDLE